MGLTALEDTYPLVNLLMQMMDGLLLCDTQQAVLLSNDAFRRMFKLATAEATDPLTLAQFPPALGDWIKPWLDPTNPTATEPDTQELTLSIQGIPKTFLVQVNPMAPQIGVSSASVSFVFQDISAIRQTERMRRDFVANVSHELRTPLSAIKGYAETLLDGTLHDDPEVAQEFVTIICKHANRLSNLVEDLLDLSKLETDDFQPELEPLDLAPIIERVVLLAFDAAAAKQIRLRQQLPRTLPPVVANANNIEQVFTNLIDNAIKYTPDDGDVVITASVQTQHQRQWVQIAIKDTGIGIEAKHIPRLFERFYRVDKARSRDIGGTGLGLSIVKHIIQYHGGDIWVDSTPNEGTCFYFTLPVAP
jgi:two-component system, OmpR family, phosphate regulon sensor histidine kinase PhoR